MSGRRVSVTIDRVVSDDPRLTRADLAAALEAQIRARLAGGADFGQSRALEARRAQAPATGGAEAVAKAVLGALGR